MNSRSLGPPAIDRDIERGIKYLRTLSTRPEICQILFQNGYNVEAHKRGWSMLLELLGYTQDLETTYIEPVPLDQELAIAELDKWNGPSFTRARAALNHLHPNQASYIFDGLKATTGAAAIGSVKAFIDRVSTLRDGTDPNRASSREVDRRAVETLEERRIFDSKIEAQLRELISKATTIAPAPPAEVQEDTTRHEAYQRSALEFHAWLTAWRETARAVIKRRDYLIRLGLSRRRRKEEAGEEPGDSGAPDIGG